MTDCPDAASIASYLDGALDELAAERLERHAADCDRCGARVEAATRLPDVGTLAREVPPPPQVRAGVLKAVVARRTRKRVMRWGGAIAAGLALVLIGSLRGPPVKEAATRPPLGPPLPLRVVESAEGVQEVRVAQAIGTLTITTRPKSTQVTWAGARDDLTEVTVDRTDGTLWLSVAPRDGARWPAEAHATLEVPTGTRVHVAGRGLLVRDLGGTGGISITGRGEVRTIRPAGIEGGQGTIHR